MVRSLVSFFPIQFIQLFSIATIVALSDVCAERDTLEALS